MLYCHDLGASECQVQRLVNRNCIFVCCFPPKRSPPRAPFDWLEQVTTGMAHAVLVNSAFTQGVFAATFKNLHARGMVPTILYPRCIAL